MAGGQSQYFGQGFSPRGEKSRFVLPADFRQTVYEACGKQRFISLDKHHKHPFLVGFGDERVARFEQELAHEEQVAISRGEPFDMDLRALQIGGFSRVSFDESGRFVLPSHLGDQVGVTDELYFHGGLRHIAIWAPEVLYAMGPEWDSVKASCRAKKAEYMAKQAARK